MSARNSQENKRLRRARRTLRKGRLPAYINLIEWIKLRTHVTNTEARRLILSGALKVDSHRIGFIRTDKQKILAPLVNADLRDRIEIAEPEKS